MSKCLNFYIFRLMTKHISAKQGEGTAIADGSQAGSQPVDSQKS